LGWVDFAALGRKYKTLGGEARLVATGVFKQLAGMSHLDYGAGSTRSQRGFIGFGPFRLYPSERALERSGVPVALGSRAFDLLAALVKSPGDVVSLEDLLGAAWPGLTVAPDNVRMQILALRRALGDGEGGAKFIESVPARGYCFIAPVVFGESDEALDVVSLKSQRGVALPARLARISGREADIANICEGLRRSRFVTVVGPGGIGKTTTATAAAHMISEDIGGVARFLDLSFLTGPDILPNAIASALGLDETEQDPISAVIAEMRHTRLLLVLDSCEHLIEAIAAVAERLFLGTSELHILATSREPMRVQGERVYQLAGLDYPAAGQEPDAAEALEFPAVSLFVERVQTSLGHFELSDHQAPIVVGICRRLDGVALAIELAAGRVGTFGIEGVAAQLDEESELSWTGRRTAISRHRTLRETIDWSFNFLTECEQAVLRRLSVVAGAFTLAAAKAVARGDGIAEDDLVEAIGSLATKSLLKVTFVNTAVQYRILDTTRAYLREKLVAAGEARSASENHAAWYCHLLQLADDHALETSRQDTLAYEGNYLDNVRLALKWSFEPESRSVFAITLATLSGALFVELSLFMECVKWCRLALDMLDEKTIGTTHELRLRHCYGRGLMATGGDVALIGAAFRRAYDIGEQLGDLDKAFMSLVQLHTLASRAGDVAQGLEIAKRAEIIASKIKLPEAAVLADWMLGLSKFINGDLADALKYCESSRYPSQASDTISRIHSGSYLRARAVCVLAWTLWLRGALDQALTLAGSFLEEVKHQNDSANLSPLTFMTQVFIEFEDRAKPEEMLDWLYDMAERHSLKPQQALVSAWRGIVRIKHGELQEGSVELESAILQLKANQYTVYQDRFYSLLSDALSQLGQMDRAQTLVDETIHHAEEVGDRFHLADMYRIKGDILARLGPGGRDAANDCYARAVALARDQGAVLWELKAEIARTRLAMEGGPAPAAVSRLAAVFAAFHEGFESRDLITARDLIDAESIDRM